MHWRTKLIQSAVPATTRFPSLSAPIYRGSTVLFDRVADIADDWRQKDRYSYGIYGTPTVLELGAQIAAMEGAHHSFITPGGQAAIALVYFAFCKAGSHALVPWSAYGPNQGFARGLLKDQGVEIEAYDPTIGAAVAECIRPNTALIWTESPGSVTMEVQDVPAIVAAAKAQGVPVALDNTWAAGVLFDAFVHGIDISVQALTKYVGGHSDLLLGSVSVANAVLYETVGAAWVQIGMGVSPDEASLALRGLQTLGVRLEHIEHSALSVACWLAEQPEIEAVLHPALVNCPGHELWERDFTGSSGVFSIIFNESITDEGVVRFVDALRLFGRGFSWGGASSLAMIYQGLKRPDRDYGGRIVRLSIGLEEAEDLIVDLEQALAMIDAA